MENIVKMETNDFKKRLAIFRQNNTSKPNTTHPNNITANLIHSNKTNPNITHSNNTISKNTNSNNNTTNTIHSNNASANKANSNNIKTNTTTSNNTNTNNTTSKDTNSSTTNSNNINTNKSNNDFKSRISMFDNTNKSNNDFKSRILKFDKTKPNANDIKPKNININNLQNNKNSKIIESNSPKEVKEVGNLKIYKYPNEKKFAPKGGAKIMLFLGDAQECFINTFINFYRSIEFKDDFRHKIDLNDKILNYFLPTYEKDKIETNIIKIISIPFCKEKNKSYVELLSKISNMKIYRVFFTFHKDINNLSLEQKKEIEFYKYLIHYLDLRDKLIFLCDTKEELKGEELNKFLNRFNFEENDNLYEGKIYSNNIYYLNNEIIYETNNNAETEKEWELLKTRMKEIQQTIIKDFKVLNKGNFFNNLLGEIDSDIRYFFNNLHKEKFYFIYFLGEIEFEKDRSKFLISLINPIIKNKNKNKKINSTNDNEIELIDDKNIKIIIGALGKISFSNLNKVNFRNSELFDENIISFKKIISTNLINLDLSFNNFQDLNNIFTEKIINLKNLNLSHNNISNLSQFINNNLNNLIELNLSFNKISDIECLGKQTNFNSLEKLDLSNNNIQKLKIINIKSLKHLDLLNNEINEGIKEFMENNKIYSDKLNLKFGNDSILFKFGNKLNIEFVYKLNGKNYTEFLEELNLNGIKNIQILESNNFAQNLDYNINDSTVKYIVDENKIILNIITKLEFKQIKSLVLINCKLIEENITPLDILFTTNLENLDLSFNNFQDLNNIFTEKIINLKNLNLSHNNISNLSQFINNNLNNLIELNLSFNKISDIECLGKQTNFNSLEKLDLSNNNIQKLKIINIKSLKHLDLLNNEINEGIKEFMENNKIYSDKLNLKFGNDSILFKFGNKLNIEFVYKLNGKNYDEFLNELNFKEIKDIKLLESDIIDKNINYNINDSIVNCYYYKNNILFNIITKIEFKQIKSLGLTRCHLVDENIKLLDILFSTDLENLDLSYNNIQDIKFLAEYDKLTKLKKLDLCHNEISDVTSLSNSKLSNLEELVLSFNKIENIDFLELNTSLNNLEKLDLSNNQITKLAKFNLRNIKNINLSDNHITDGINDFMLGINNINNLSHKLILEKLNKDKFKYVFDTIVNFKYYIKDNKDVNQFLKELSFSGINYLKLIGFDDTCIKFLSNESLKDLKELDIEENSLTKISIFDNIHFPEINKINVSEKDFSDDNLNSLKFFSSIKMQKININKRNINIKYKNPELNIKIDNFNLLYNDMGDIDEIRIDSIPDNSDVFSYNSFSNKKLPIFKNIKLYIRKIYMYNGI